MSTENPFPTRNSISFPLDETASPWFEVEQVDHNIWGIREKGHFEDVLSFYVKGSTGNVLIDSGMGFADIKLVLPSGEEPTVLLTHSHWDHMGGAPSFNSIAVLGHPYEISRVKTGWRPDEIIGYARENFTVPIPETFIPEQYSISGIPQVASLKDEEIIDLGNVRIKVIHTPGHTPGSASFFIEDQGILITGDTLYPGPEYVHMRESNANDYLESLERLARETEGRLRLILPGHNRYTAQPDLLYRHIEALRGNLKPLITSDAGNLQEDEFGPYIERKYEDFSLLLPPEVKLVGESV